MPYPRTIGSGLGAAHGHKSISKPYPFGSDIHGYPCPWIKLPSLIAKNELSSKIHADIPSIMEEEFQKFKENCGKEEVKARSEKMKAL